jgi:hypothetical protein
MINRIELTLMMTKILGHAVEACDPSFEDWADKSRIPAGPLRDGLKRMYIDYDEFGFPGGNSVVLEAILGREPRSLQEFFLELAQRERAAA